MNTFLLVMSIPTIGLLIFVFGFLGYRICYGFLAAASCTWWMFQCGRLNGFAKTTRPAWTYFPGEFFYQWWSFGMSKPGSITVSHTGGCWNGIRKFRSWKSSQ